MAQSDYIQYKSLKNELLYQKKLNPILNSQDYTLFVKYSIETTIPNTNILYNQLIPPKNLYHPTLDISNSYIIPDTCKTVCPNVPSSILGIGKPTIFNIEQTTNGCPTFIDCSGTDQRPNRVRNKFVTNTRVPITPVPKYTKIKASRKCTFNAKYRSRLCICNSKLCKCGTTICSS